jgi:hypothetical protein
MHTEKIQPIINGDANPRLTPELFKDLDPRVKRQVIWNIMVSMEFAHSYRDIDREVFEHSPFKGKLEYSDIQEEGEGALDLDKLFVTVRKEFEDHQNRLSGKTANRRFELGKKIHAAQKELGFGGWMELDKNRMQGYIHAGGSWNDFDAPKVSYAVSKLHSLAPRSNYGPNNPNTGNLLHKWKSVHSTEYLVMEFDYVDSKVLEEVKEFYSKHWEPVGKSIKADSIRYEVTEHGNNYFGIELIMWWD